LQPHDAGATAPGGDTLCVDDDPRFDCPLPAATLARRATTLKVRSAVLRIASTADLLRLKKIARTHRSAPGDVEDIAFLEAFRAKRR